MLRTTNLSFGKYIGIVMDLQTSKPKRYKNIFSKCLTIVKNPSIVRNTLRTSTLDFTILLDTVKQQEKQLNTIIEKSTLSIKRIKHCPAIQGLIVPIDDIRNLLASYAKNVQKLSYYWRKMVRSKTRSRIVAIFSMAILIIFCLVTLILGAVFLYDRGFTPVIHDVTLERIRRIITTDLGSNASSNESWVAEENSTISHNFSVVNRSTAGLVIDPHYSRAFATPIVLCIISVLFLTVLSGAWSSGIKTLQKVFSRTTAIATIDRNCRAYTKFFDLLYDKRTDAINPILDKIEAKQRSSNLAEDASKKLLLEELSEKLKDLNPERYAIYDRSFFIYDEQLQSLYKRLSYTVKDNQKK